MVSCKDCIHYSVCGYVEFQDLECKQFKPTADVVEVVRCKDCKYNMFEQPDGIVHCHVDPICKFRKSTDFCSYGERKE